MDVGSFVQENKRWLIGCVVGALVWLIGTAVVNSIYDVDGAMRQQFGIVSKAAAQEVFPREALAAARDEATLLAEERQRLERELAFVPSAKYQLAGNGDANQYLFLRGSELKKRILTDANERNIDVGDKDVSWPVPAGIDDIRGVLFGIEVLDEVALRLIRCHDARLAADPDAMGIRQIGMCKLDERRAQRASPVRRGEVSLRDLLVEERVSFVFHGDEATLAAFLESCHQPGRSLAIETWSLQQPQRRGDPCQLKGSLLGIAWKPAAEEKN